MLNYTRDADPTHVPLQAFLHALVQTSTQLFEQDCNAVGKIAATVTMPNIGKAFLAASLKNSLLP